ncbi:hypothetical protein MJO28_001100 [Puccinia striiformis f. sp. tritici]|uniref:RING-type domain-containing protein n=4 Tax=Puccinia striiformis TaxID=27350 RepID=A0A0L0VBF4_9BASI|nr:hypothetical protein Pst134EB_001336 [Puccinia striiformis f. sp. tritici]KAI7963006.1 hypothetical protein MJO28_001100 [Puccinia striiformis f. sp. tritici]KAI9607529.1 hypothetical protein KEM48_001539 [Puccinia striiformis f. sp. tritici PST-130]KNE96605.1 hypothetical protein PSTG_10163 [Puccinia striiformis f. sp. tritici PST-78]POW02382.1 hypothetical protein PSTT_11830 [Puccinia striiformis]
MLLTFSPLLVLLLGQLANQCFAVVNQLEGELEVSNDLSKPVSTWSIASSPGEPPATPSPIFSHSGEVRYCSMCYKTLEVPGDQNKWSKRWKSALMKLKLKLPLPFTGSEISGLYQWRKCGHQFHEDCVLDRVLNGLPCPVCNAKPWNRIHDRLKQKVKVVE